MGLLGGAFNAIKGAARIATSPLRTALKMTGTTLATGGNVVTELAEGDLKGAAGVAVGGVKTQVGNVTGYFGDNLTGVKEVAGGFGSFVGGGLGLIGTPILGAARLTGNGLATTGNTLNELGQGDVGGAAAAYAQGQGNGLGIVGDTFKQELNHLF